MIKIFITVRNRLSITKKCLLAIKKHSTIPHQIYVYDNLTNHLLKEHFEFWYQMYEKGIINQITFTDQQSTFNAFSKAVSINLFGSQHMFDPNKDKYDYLMMIDNDIILTPEWDKILFNAWNDVKKRKLENIKSITQLPGGIKSKINLDYPIGEKKAKIGYLSGGGIQCVKSNFFEDIGFLPIKDLVGHNKRSDQIYWRLMEKKTNGKPYVLGLDHKIGIHCGKLTGSMCNTLTRQKNDKNLMEKIKFKDAEERIEKMSFEEFYEMIRNDKELMNDW